MASTNNGTAEPQSPGVMSDGDFDDNLDVPENVSVIDIRGSQIILNNDENDGSSPDNKISFRNVHARPVKFTSFHRDIFIPAAPIEVTITDCETHHTTHLLNPNLYTISFKHGDFTWQIKKRYKHIQDLHHQLLLFKASLNIPFPSKEHRRRRESFRNAPSMERGRKKLPRFPKKPEVLVSYEQLDNRMKQLSDYLRNLLTINIYRYHSATAAFLEVSHLSFIHDLGVKGKEGMVEKRTGSTLPGQSGCNCLGCIQNTCCLRCKHICQEVLCSSWRERWFFLKDTCFGYIDPKFGSIKCVILYDQGFEVSSGAYSTGLHKAFHIVTLSRQIVIKCRTRSERKSWIENLKLHANELASDFTRPNRHYSFAPIRSNATASWFVDGATYMNAVAEAIDAAREEVFIADWWLSPEIYLRRPAIEGDYWRLDKLLKRKAEQGVKIFILLYKEFEMALGLNSYYSKQILSSSHENIKVLRHPDHAKVGVYLWAHHEKLVCVDQTYAFVGGIDLCYGRWDDYQHRLIDLGSATPSVNVTALKKKTSTVPGGDNFRPIPTPLYKQTNPEIRIDENEKDDDEDDSDSGNELPQLQPGDQLMIPNTMEYMKMNTPELQRKHGLRAIKKKVKSKGIELLNLVYSHNEDSVDELDDTQMVEKEETELKGSSKYWMGKDYCNFIVKDFTNLDAPLVDFIDRLTTPRMPWHDVAVCVQGACARDIARHFIQRWNATKLEKARLNKSYPYLLPKAYNIDKIEEIISVETHKVTCQVLRSVSTWSCGFLEPNTIEQSIHDAYLDAIKRSQHYIYIENQFFISLPNSNSTTRNQIHETLYNRIFRAYKENATFRVYVILPLLPGFEGEVGGPTGTSIRAITHWNYASISRGKDALLNRLKEAGIEDPTRYISFYGLRNHSKLNGEPITELIYVHSKLMIVDDRIVICGSANINDRSLIGKRDSELAVLIEDDEFDDGVMNGHSFPSGKYAGNLRKFLFKEHLGLVGCEHEMIDVDVSDPVSDYFYNEVWHKTASLNTEFYDKVFHCIPSDNVETIDKLKSYVSEEPYYSKEISRAENMLENIQGHLVLFPLNFLCKENLTPTVSSVEGMMPTSLWI